MRIEKCLSLTERVPFLSHLISKYLWQILNVPGKYLMCQSLALEGKLFFIQKLKSTKAGEIVITDLEELIVWRNKALSTKLSR